MLTSSLKSQIDKIWTTFWSGGISNPLTVIEQITYLLFIRRLDELQIREENKARYTGTLQNPIYHPDEQHLRWSVFKDLEAENMFENFRKIDGVFDFMKNKGVAKDSVFNKYMKGATFMIPMKNLK